MTSEKPSKMKEKRRNVICLVTNIFEEDFINSLTEDERRNMQYIRQDTILFNDPQKRERVEKTLWLLNNIIVISTKKHKTTKENYQDFLADFPTLDLAHKHKVMIYFSIQGIGSLNDDYVIDKYIIIASLLPLEQQ